MTKSPARIALTHADFKVAIESAEFLIGQRVSGDDVRWLLSTIADGWE